MTVSPDNPISATRQVNCYQLKILTIYSYIASTDLCSGGLNFLHPEESQDQVITSFYLFPATSEPALASDVHMEKGLQGFNFNQFY